MDRRELFAGLGAQARALLAAEGPREETAANLCRLLRERVPHYDWVGFYLVRPGKKLVLGPYAGAPTEHRTIGFGRGVCGQAAEKRETIVVQDVCAESNYLACSTAVKSEIVVPVFKEGELAAVIDIDSHRPAPFTPEDSGFLEQLCAGLGVLF